MIAAISCIPRYNWDYGFADLFRAAQGALRPPDKNGFGRGVLLGRPCLFTTSGRASLYAILTSLRLPAGSLVGVPLFCCPVVFDAIARAGLRPAFIDIEPETFTIAPDDLAKKSKRLQAIIAVHMFGHQADMAAVNAVAGGTPVIEDCAQGLLSACGNNYAGNSGTAAFFSFRSGKYISAGEGSAITARSPGLLDAIGKTVKRFPDWKIAQSLLHCTATYIKSALYRRPLYGTLGRPLGRRLDAKLNLTAKSGVLLRQISPADHHLIEYRLLSIREKINRQRELALYYLNVIALRGVTLPFEKPGHRSTYYQFALRTGGQKERDGLAAHLADRNIDSAKYLDDVAVVAGERFGYAGECPVAERCAKTTLTIPNYYTLSNDDAVHIARSANSYNGGIS